MNAIEQARQAYAPAQAPCRTDRSTEHLVFSRITSALLKADQASPPDFPRLVAALHENRRLWTILAADVADDGNSLPRQLRAQIFYLAEFTDLHTDRVLRGEATAAALIDINTAMMRGLSGQGGR